MADLHRRKLLQSALTLAYYFSEAVDSGLCNGEDVTLFVQEINRLFLPPVLMRQGPWDAGEASRRSGVPAG